jgi:hypothetical protein
MREHHAQFFCSKNKNYIFPSSPTNYISSEQGEMDGLSTVS